MEESSVMEELGVMDNAREETKGCPPSSGGGPVLEFQSNPPSE